MQVKVEQASAGNGHRDLLWIIAAGSLAFFVLLGHRPMYDWDEAIYADIAREFLHGPSCVVPFWNFHPWLERTPLFEWATAACFAVFGVSPFWARAVAALSGVLTATVIYRLASELCDRRVALTACVVLITTEGYFSEARSGTTDAMLTLWMSVSIWGLWRITRNVPSGWYLFWIGLAPGIMTKSAGPAPVVLTAVVVLSLHRHTIQFRQRELLWGFLSFLVIVLPWHAYMLLHFGRQFVDDYLGRQILARSTHSLEGHAGTPFYYVIRIAKGAFPWSLLLIGTVADAWRKRHLGVLEWYALVLFVFYTGVRTKLPWYIVPFYPALAILAARQLVPVLRPQLLRPALAGLYVAFTTILLIREVRLPYDRPELLMLEDPATRAVTGPLILCSDRFILDRPSALFYADRRTLQAYLTHLPTAIQTGEAFDPKTNDPKFRDPQPLESLLTQEPELIILENALVPAVKQRFAYQTLRRDAHYEVGVIRRHS